MKNTSRTSALNLISPQRIFALPRISVLVNVKFLLILSIIFIILFLAVYIFQISTVISQGYQIQSYQKKIDEVAQTNKNLEINTVKINSLENIDAKIQELGFEKTDKIDYLQILEGPVVSASKKME